MREAVAVADAQVDFSPYSIVYVMPPRNATGIEFSPELNFYQEPLRPDGKVIRNGVTYGNDIFHLGPPHHQPRDRPRHLVPGVLQRRPGRHAPVGRRLGRDGRPARPRAGQHGLEQVEGRLARQPRHRLRGLRRHGRHHALGQRRALRRRPDQEGGGRAHRAAHRADRRAARAGRRRRDGDDHARPAPALRLGRAASTSSTCSSSTPTARSRSSTRCRGRPQAGCARDLDIATLGKGQGDGPSRYEDADTGTVFEVRAIDDAAGSATLRVTRAATRIEAAPASGVGPLTTTLTAKQLAAPAGATYSWSLRRHGRVGRAHLPRRAPHRDAHRP